MSIPRSVRIDVSRDTEYQPYGVCKSGVALDIDNQSSIPRSQFLSSVYNLQVLRARLTTLPLSSSNMAPIP